MVRYEAHTPTPARWWLSRGKKSKTWRRGLDSSSILLGYLEKTEPFWLKPPCCKGEASELENSREGGKKICNPSWKNAKRIHYSAESWLQRNMGSGLRDSTAARILVLIPDPTRGTGSSSTKVPILFKGLTLGDRIDPGNQAMALLISGKKKAASPSSSTCTCRCAEYNNLSIFAAFERREESCLILYI